MRTGWEKIHCPSVGEIISHPRQHSRSWFCSFRDHLRVLKWGLLFDERRSCSLRDHSGSGLPPVRVTVAVSQRNANIRIPKCVGRREDAFSNGPIGLVLNLKEPRDAQQILAAGKFTENVLHTSWLGARTRELRAALTLGSSVLIHHEAVPSTPLLTYGAQPLLRSCQLCGHSRTSQQFMEPESSLPC
jgi:hypothetical protein